MNVMNLEINDYQRTVESVQLKLTTKEHQLDESKLLISNLEETNRSNEQEISK